MITTLIDKQFQFTLLLIDLLKKAHELGYAVTLGEAYRTPEQAKLYAAQGKGIANSLHIQRLAIDLNLFKDNNFLIHTDDYKPLGEYWEGLSGNGLQCCWGGRFSRADGNHFSIAHGGRK